MRSRGGPVLHVPIEPRFGDSPFALHRPGRNAQDVGGLLDGETAEESQLDDAALLRVESLQGGEGFVQRDGIDVNRLGRRKALDERDPSHCASTFGSFPPPRVVDEDPPHQLRGDREEMRPVLPLHVTLIDQLQIRLVHKRRGLQRVVRALAPEVPPGQRLQFGVDHGHHSVEGFLVASPALLEELGQFRRSWKGGHCTSRRGAGSSAAFNSD
jgi:hypothetical protein